MRRIQLEGDQAHSVVFGRLVRVVERSLEELGPTGRFAIEWSSVILKDIVLALLIFVQE